MKNVEKRIDRSVKPLTENKGNEDMKNGNKSISAIRAEKLKSALVEKLSAEYAEVGEHMVCLAVNEADALASLTPVPLLVLPTLAEEKVQEAAAWSARQRRVFRSDLVALAA